MEEEQYQQEMPRLMPYQSPMYNYGSSIITLTNPDSELRRMELTFRAMIEDKDGNPVAIIGAFPLMNEIGISSIIGQTQAIVSQVTVLSSINKQELHSLIDFLADTLARDLMINRSKYGIRSVADRDKIYFITLSKAYICMKRAAEESLNDKKFWRGSVQEIRSTVEANQGKSSNGLLSSLNPWRK